MTLNYIVFVLAATTVLGTINASIISDCNLIGQYLVFRFNCTSEEIDCDLITNDNVKILNNNESFDCCPNLKYTNTISDITCNIVTDCYELVYGRTLSPLSLYINGTQKDFTKCTEVNVGTTPPVYTIDVISCKNCTADVNNNNNTYYNSTLPTVISSSSSYMETNILPLALLIYFFTFKYMFVIIM